MTQVNLAGDLTKRIMRAIQSAVQFRINNLTVTIENNTLTLAGQAPNFDYKKIAQDCALRLTPGSMLIRNQIVVA